MKPLFGCDLTDPIDLTDLIDPPDLVQPVCPG
jgi:hypothetical protein